MFFPLRCFLYFRKQNQMMKAHLTQAALSIDVTLDSLKEQVAEVLTPRLGVDIPFVYPRKEVDLEVKYRNLSGLTVELYRMNLPVTSHILEKEITASKVSQYGKLVSTLRPSFPSTAAKIDALIK